MTNSHKKNVSKGLRCMDVATCRSGHSNPLKPGHAVTRPQHQLDRLICASFCFNVLHGATLRSNAQPCPLSACVAVACVISLLLVLVQGVIGLSRKAGHCSGFIKIGRNEPTPFPAAMPCPEGAVLMGVQILYGYNFSVTISDIRTDYFNKFHREIPSSSETRTASVDDGHVTLPVTAGSGTAASKAGSSANLGLIAPAATADDDDNKNSVGAAAEGADGAVGGVQLPSVEPLLGTSPAEYPKPAAAAPKRRPLPPAAAVQAAVQSTPAAAGASNDEPLCEVTAAEDPMYPNGFIPKGVGGGGPLSSFSMSPYTDLWLVGTKAGTVYRSTNRGTSWAPIDQEQIRMSGDLPFAPPVGFSADGTTLFFAPCWGADKNQPCVAKRSTDGGVTWNFMDVNSEGDTVFGNPKLPANQKR